MKNKTLEEIFGDAVTSYSRKQAIEDGVLVDLSAEAQIIGFVIPVACTSSVSEFIKDASDTADLLFKLKRLAQMSLRNQNRIDFTFKGQEVYSLVGPGDTADPVITIRMRGED